MNRKRIGSWLLALAVLCGILSGAAAEAPEGQVLCSYNAVYMENGFLYESFDRTMVYYYDFASGQRMPLCTRPNCDHRPVNERDPNSFHYSVAEFMNDNSSLCYAARLAYAGMFENSMVLYDGKLYFFPLFYQDPPPGANTVPLYVSEVDGETRQLTDLGQLFSGAYDPYPTGVVAYDGCLYYLFYLYPKEPLEGQKAIEPDPDLQPGSYQLVKCSMATGEASILETFYAESCDINLMGIYGGVLYYRINAANGLDLNLQDGREQADDTRNKCRYSVLGIDVNTGEKVMTDRRLCDRAMQKRDGYEIVRDGMLYSILPPDTPDNQDALFLKYDLNRRETVLEYSFKYDTESDYYPYRVLTDEVVLSFDFETGTFALQNLKTGEIKPLSIPGACIKGNAEADWYDIFVEYIQTDPLILDHRFADTDLDKAYISVDELLNENDPQMHEFSRE